LRSLSAARTLDATNERFKLIFPRAFFQLMHHDVLTLLRGYAAKLTPGGLGFSLTVRSSEQAPPEQTRERCTATT
jgi:hypothetical protein